MKRIEPVIMATLTAVIPNGLKKVPPFPPIASKLLALFSDPKVEMGKVAALIKSDPALTARLLQYVNSMAFGLREPVSSVQQAVQLLGLDRTRQITLTSATAGYAGQRASQNLTRCWHHSLATAVLSEEIARACGAYENVAFVSGVMHDIGRLGLLLAYPQEYGKLLKRAHELNSVDVLDLEERQFGLHHAEAGRILARTWGLPDDFVIIAGRITIPAMASSATCSGSCTWPAVLLPNSGSV